MCYRPTNMCNYESATTLFCTVTIPLITVQFFTFITCSIFVLSSLFVVQFNMLIMLMVPFVNLAKIICFGINKVLFYTINLYVKTQFCGVYLVFRYICYN